MGRKGNASLHSRTVAVWRGPNVINTEMYRYPTNKVVTNNNGNCIGVGQMSQGKWGRLGTKVLSPTTVRWGSGKGREYNVL